MKTKQVKTTQSRRKVVVPRKARKARELPLIAVFTDNEWWSCVVTHTSKAGKSRCRILRTDLSSDQLGFFGAYFDVQLGEDVSEFVETHELGEAPHHFKEKENPYFPLSVMASHYPEFLSAAQVSNAFNANKKKIIRAKAKIKEECKKRSAYDDQMRCSHERLRCLLPIDVIQPLYLNVQVFDEFNEVARQVPYRQYSKGHWHEVIECERRENGIRMTMVECGDRPFLTSMRFKSYESVPDFLACFYTRWKSGLITLPRAEQENADFEAFEKDLDITDSDTVAIIL